MTAEFRFDGKTHNCTLPERAPDPNQAMTTESCNLDYWPPGVAAEWQGGKLAGFTAQFPSYTNPPQKEIHIRILHGEATVRSGLFAPQYEYYSFCGAKCGTASVVLRE